MEVKAVSLDKILSARNRKGKTSGQDGGVRRYTLPPHTTKRRATTNLNTKNNQNCQKIKLYGSLTTKELKKKHSFRLVGGAGWGPGGQGAGWWTRQSHTFTLCPCKPRGTTEEWDRLYSPEFQWEEIKPQNLSCKNLWKLQQREELPASQESSLERLIRSSLCTSPPTQESAPEGPNLLVSSRGSNWKLAESQASSIDTSWAPLPHTAPQPHNQGGLPHPGKYLKLHPSLLNRHAQIKKKKNGPNERTDRRSRKKKSN